MATAVGSVDEVVDCPAGTLTDVAEAMKAGSSEPQAEARISRDVSQSRTIRFSLRPVVRTLATGPPESV